MPDRPDELAARHAPAATVRPRVSGPGASGEHRHAAPGPARSGRHDRRHRRPASRDSWFLVAVLIAVVIGARASSTSQPGSAPGSTSPASRSRCSSTLSVLLHEISPRLMAERFGFPVNSITLHFLGGVTEIEGEAADAARRSSWIAVVGPLTSLAVGGVALRPLAASRRTGCSRGRGRRLAGANLLVGVLNLVPGPAARRRPGAAGGRLGRDRQPAPRHHRRRLGRPGRGRRGAGLAAASRSRSSATPPTSTRLPRWRSSSRLFLWIGATQAHVSRPAARPAARTSSRARWPAGPSRCPRTCRWPRRSAAPRRPRPAARDRRPAPARPSAWSARRRCWPPPRTAAVGAGRRPWPGRSTRGCALPPTSTARTGARDAAGTRPPSTSWSRTTARSSACSPPATSTGPFANRA